MAKRARWSVIRSATQSPPDASPASTPAASTSAPPPTQSGGRPSAAGRALLLLLAPLVFLLVFYAWPMSHVLGDAFDVESWQWAAGPYMRNVLRIALLQASLSTILALVVAAPLAWLHHRYRILGSRTQLALHAMPFVMPVFVIVYGIQGLLGVPSWINRSLDIDLQHTLGPLAFVAIANAYYNYGLATRLLHQALEQRPFALESAAQTLGAPPRTAFVRTSLRLLAPSLLAPVLLVFLFSFASFGVVAFLGAPSVQSLETVLYSQVNGGAAPYPHHAAVVAVLQATINIALLALALRLTRTRIPAQPRPAKQRAGAARNALAAATTLIAVAPMASVLGTSLRVGGSWSLAAWRSFIDADAPGARGDFDLGHALGLSLTYALWAVALSLTFVLLLAYAARRLGGRTRRVTEALASLPLATSSLMLGVGFSATFGATGLLDLRGSRIPIIVAHTLLAFPFTARIVLPALEQQDRALDDAARLLGAPASAILRRIHVPLLWPALAASAAFAAALSLADYGSSLLLMTRTNDMGLSIWITLLDQPFKPIARAQAAAAATILGVLVGLAYLCVERFTPANAQPLRPRTPHAATPAGVASRADDARRTTETAEDAERPDHHVQAASMPSTPEKTP